MNYGEHLSMLIALIVGLAVTELLAGASRTLKRRREASFSWLPFLQAILIGSIILVLWLASYVQLSGRKYSSTLAYLSLLFAPGLLYFASTRVFPAAEGEGLDVRTHATTNAGAVNIPPALWMMFTLLSNLYFFWPNWRAVLIPNIGCGVAALALMTAAFTPSAKILWIATLIALAVVFAFISVYLPSPPGQSQLSHLGG